MADTSFLAWPFFEDRHREFHAALEDWCAANLPVDHHDVDAACRALVSELGRGGFLTHTAIDPEIGGTLDVRTLCLARETLARHDGLADFAFAMQGLGTGALSLFGTPEQKEWLKKTRAGSLMMWGFTWGAGTPDGGFFLGIAYGPNASESNDARFALPAYDRLFERQQVLPDGPEREALMRQAQKLLTAYMPYKAHAHGIANVLSQPWLHGLWPHPFMRDTWAFLQTRP